MADQKPPYRPVMMADVLEAEGRYGLNVASTFSGAGGSCTGYRLAGFTLRWANEFEPNAIESYSRNCQAGCILDQRDIRTIKGSEILERLALERGELDLFDGSPPCQSFSTAGKKEKGWGKSIAHGDGTTQRSDDLFEEYIRLVSELRPRVFIAENVTGLVKGVSKGYFKITLSAMERIGYSVQAAIVDARWLDVPQARQRVIFVGVRKDLAKRLPMSYRSFPIPKPYFYSIADACPWINAAAHWTGKSSFMPRPADILNAPSPTITIGVCNDGHYLASGIAGHPPCSDPIDCEVKELSSSSRKAWEETRIGHNHPKHFSCDRPDPARACPTIQATHGAPGVFGTSHPFEPRRFTILELKRISSFPDDFKLLGTFEQRWARLGNSVPPLMMKAIAENVRDQILLPLRALGA